MAEPGTLAGSEMYPYGFHLDIWLLSEPVTLLGPYLLLFWCYLPGTDECGSTYPPETRMLIKVY